VADNNSPYITAHSSRTINKIQTNSNALYGNVKYDDNTIPITIDTGANVCVCVCVCQTTIIEYI